MFRTTRIMRVTVILFLLDLSVSAIPFGQTRAAAKSATPPTGDVHVSCVDSIGKADPSKQASMVAGTVVGFVAGAIASKGDPSIIIIGTYVGCESGKAFAAAFKTDQEKAMVLLNPYMFAFVKTNAGQTLIVFAGKIAGQTQQQLQQAAQQGSMTGNPLEASFRAIVTPDGVVNPIGNVTAATLASVGVDPKTAATIGIIVNPGGAVAQSVKKAFDDNNPTIRGGRGCFGLC